MATGKKEYSTTHYDDRKKMIEDILRAKEGYKNSSKVEYWEQEIVRKQKAISDKSMKMQELSKATFYKDVNDVAKERMIVEEETKENEKSTNSAFKILTMWASSTKNIIGASSAAAITLTGTMVGAGGWVPLLAAGAYAVGIIFSPEDKNSADTVKQLEEKASRKAISASKKTAPVIPASTALTQKVYEIKNDAYANDKLSNVAKRTIEEIIVLVGEICQNYEALEANIESKILLENIVNNYLPDSIKDYVVLPKSYAVTTLIKAKKTPKEIFEQNLILISQATLEIRDNVYAGNAQNLEIQGSFLKAKFQKEIGELSL